jgi:hypothetical protein
VEAGQEILIVSHVDGLYGGDNVVDLDAVGWIQSGIAARGANPTVLWIDEPMKPHAWRIPPAMKAAIKASDILILNSLDLEIEENVEMKDLANVDRIPHIHNFATTAPLLCTATPATLAVEVVPAAPRSSVSPFATVLSVVPPLMPAVGPAVAASGFPVPDGTPKVPVP